MHKDRCNRPRRRTLFHHTPASDTLTVLTSHIRTCIITCTRSRTRTELAPAIAIAIAIAPAPAPAPAPAIAIAHAHAPPIAIAITIAHDINDVGNYGAEHTEDILDLDDDDNIHNHPHGGDPTTGADGVLLMRFCPHDSSMLYPKEDHNNKQLLYAYRLCQYTERATNPMIYKNTIKKEVKNVLHTVPGAISDDPTLPRSRNASCENCGHHEAVFFQSDTYLEFTGLDIILSAQKGEAFYASIRQFKPMCVDLNCIFIIIIVCTCIHFLDIKDVMVRIGGLGCR